MSHAARIDSKPSAVVAIFAMMTSMAAGLWCVGAAAAQMNPEGNKHPQEAISDAATTDLLDPHGESRPRAVEARKKYEFSQKVALKPIAGLAVMSNSRVGVLDTVARDTVRRITGRRTYQDFLPPTDGAGALEKVDYDPLFTFVDLMADRFYYLDKPLIHVEFLGLRRGLLDGEFPGKSAQREFYMKLTRVTPETLAHQENRLETFFGSDAAYADAVGRVSMAARLYGSVWQRLMIIAPATADGAWGHASTDSEVARLWSQLGTAWRARDAAEVNRIVASIGQAVPAVNAEQYPPSWRRSLETTYNGAGKFIIGYVLYFFSFVTMLVAMGTGRVSLRRIATGMLLGGLAIHLTGFVIRWILAERIPIQNQFESMLGLCLGACLFGTVLMLVRKQPVFGAAAAGVGFLTLMTATLAGIPGQEIQREAAILNTSYILFYHVNIVLFSYGLISLGAIVSSVYLATYYLRGEGALRLAAAGVGTIEVSAGMFAGSGSGAGSAGEASAASGGASGVAQQRLLNDLDHAQMVILQLAFWILGVGVCLGAWWADHSWGRFWAFDPKETWALITWIVYLIIVHVRLVAPKRGLLTAWLSIAGFFVMLWTYFGVNLILPGLHAYA